MVTASFISRLSHAVDLIEKLRQQNRPLKDSPPARQQWRR
jgi:hypothetical protein